MSAFDPRTDLIERWRAIVDALDQTLQAQALESDRELVVAPAEVDDVRRLIMLRIAARRRDNLPMYWARRSGGAIYVAVDPETTSDAAGNGETPAHPSDSVVWLRTDWRE